MVRAAPRYAGRLEREISRLDDENEPIAEICRRVAARAQELGLVRPSHVHLRELVRAARERRAEERELRELRREAVVRLAVGLPVDVDALEARIERILERGTK